MTVLNKNDYDRFTWRHRKIITVIGLIIIILRILTIYGKISTGIIINDILSLLTVMAFLMLVEVYILKNYEKSIKNFEN